MVRVCLFDVHFNSYATPLPEYLRIKIFVYDSRTAKTAKVTQGGVLSALKSMEPVGNPVNSCTVSKYDDSPFVSHLGSLLD